MTNWLPVCDNFGHRHPLCDMHHLGNCYCFLHVHYLLDCRVFRLATAVAAAARWRGVVRRCGVTSVAATGTVRVTYNGCGVADNRCGISISATIATARTSRLTYNRLGMTYNWCGIRYNGCGMPMSATITAAGASWMTYGWCVAWDWFWGRWGVRDWSRLSPTWRR